MRLRRQMAPARFLTLYQLSLSSWNHEGTSDRISGGPVTLTRIASIPAVLLATALMGCSAGTVTAEDPMPAVTTGAAGPAGTPLVAAIADIPTATETRDGYDRDAFKHWVDADDDRCDAREEVLIAEAVKVPKQGDDCTLTGGEWLSYYDGKTVTDASRLDIDHMVPLAEAWDSGAAEWTAERREGYANDLGAERSLVAVTAKSNRSKGDRDPAEWLPPVASVLCTYATDWTATKLRWGLAADEAERTALEELAKDCPDSTVSYETAP